MEGIKGFEGEYWGRGVWKTAVLGASPCVLFTQFFAKTWFSDEANEVW